MQQTLLSMSSMESRLEDKLTATNLEVQGLRERVIAGEVNLGTKVDNAIKAAVSRAVVVAVE